MMELIGILNVIEYWYFDNDDKDKRKVHTYFDGFWNFANNGDASNLFADYMNHLTNARAEALARMPKRVEFEGYNETHELDIEADIIFNLLKKLQEMPFDGRVKVIIEEVQE